MFFLRNYCISFDSYFYDEKMLEIIILFLGCIHFISTRIIQNIYYIQEDPELKFCP